MKKILFVIAILVTGAFAYSQAPNTWIQKADFGGTGRAFATGFNIGKKGYLGTGYNGITSNYQKDFWEYDPATNTWTQKADFGGTARAEAVGFSIGSKGYIGTGFDSNFIYQKDFWEYNPATNIWTQKADFGGVGRARAVGFSIEGKGYIGTGDSDTPPFYTKDFWEYDPATNIWARKADFGGTIRADAAGFSIDNKGYLGTGIDNSYYQVKDFWEYDPVADSWTRRSDFRGTERQVAVGFSIGKKGYIGSGIINSSPYNSADFWEYDPATNSWTKKVDFGGGGRYGAVGFSIGNRGYIGTGTDDNSYYKDFWKYNPGCQAPFNLSVPKISDTAAALKWTLPAGSISSFRIHYRVKGSSAVLNRNKTGSDSRVVLKGLLPNTTYQWQIRSNCTADTSDWVSGPDFTTLPSAGFSSDVSTINGSKVEGNISMQVIPNPNRGNFTIQMQLPAKAASTTIVLYNNLGVKIWQQDAGKLNGSVNVNIALESRLSTGVYMLLIEHGDTRLMQKVVVTK